jgi:hypothetical protein
VVRANPMQTSAIASSSSGPVSIDPVFAGMGVTGNPARRVNTNVRLEIEMCGKTEQQCYRYRKRATDHGVPSAGYVDLRGAEWQMSSVSSF